VLGTYASAVAISVIAVVLGRGAVILCGGRGSSWLSAPVGLALLLAGCDMLVYLPGHGYTAGAVLLIMTVGAVLLGRRRKEGWPPLAEGLAVAVVALGLATIPFITNDRVGTLGVSVLNDTHWHLFLAQGLLQPSIRHLDDYGLGYPLGPHAIAAVFSQSLGTSVDHGLTGLLMAVPVLGGLAALGVLADLRRWQRLLPAMLAALPYMAAAWYVQSAFKEPIMSVLLLGIVIVLQEGCREHWARPAAVLVPLAVIVAGVIYEYSYPGLVWPVAVLVCWGLLELSAAGGWRHVPAISRWARGALVPLAAAVVALVALVAFQLPRIHDFYTANGGSGVGTGTTGGITVTDLANLAHPLPAFEGMNVSLWGDWRLQGLHASTSQLIAVLALILLLIAAGRALYTRELPWLGAAIGVALVYAYSKHSQSPYVAAKALMVPAPILVLGSGALLMRGIDAASWRRLSQVPWRGMLAIVSAGVAVAFFAVSFGTSYLVLADAAVGPNQHTAQLRSLRRLLHGKPTLAMFNDDYFKWELLGVPVAEPGYDSPIAVANNPEKPWAYGQPLDFDSFSPQILDGFDYVVSVRSAALSQPPSNFHRIGATADYVVYKRVGPTPDFHVLPESGQPGAVLDCSKASLHALSRRRGTAEVRPAPLDTAVSALVPGQSETLELKLPAGRWALSLPFTSPQPIHVRGPGLSMTIAPNLDRPGNPWPAGEVTSRGHTTAISIQMEDPAALHSSSPASQFFAPQTLIATRVGADRTVPLRRACGRYVDSYTLG
jgi:hypothetical protein